MNLDRIKERLQRLQDKTYGKVNTAPSIFLKLQEGETTVRIPPMKDGDPFRDYFLHYNVGREFGFLCPQKNYGKPCPVCDFAYELYKEAVETEDETQKNLAKDLFAKQRFYSPILVRGEEDKGIRWWSYGKTIYEQLLRMSLNPEYGDITDMEKGTDLVLTYKKPTKKGAFPETTCDPRRSTSKFCDDLDKDECQVLLDEMPDLMTGLRTKTFDEIKEALDNMMLSGADPEKSSSEAEKFGSSKKEDKPGKKTKPKSKKDSKTVVDEAFKELGLDG